MLPRTAQIACFRAGLAAPFAAPTANLAAAPEETTLKTAAGAQ
jgi:hypothetical protein